MGNPFWTFSNTDRNAPNKKNLDCGKCPKKFLFHFQAFSGWGTSQGPRSVFKSLKMVFKKIFQKKCLEKLSGKTFRLNFPNVWSSIFVQEKLP